MGKGRKVSSISKEFDGKEVQGKLIERAGLFGSKMSKEVFKMPSGGKHIEKTRTNKKGDVVSRMSRDTKVNPLKFFNDNKEKAIKKAGGEMDMFKKSLKRADNGIQMGPMTEAQSIFANARSSSDDPMSGGRGPRMYAPSEERNMDVKKLLKSRANAPIVYPPIQGAYEEYMNVQKTKSKKGGPVKRKK